MILCARNYFILFYCYYYHRCPFFDFRMNQVSCIDGTLHILPISADEHCLFSAILHQFHVNNVPGVAACSTVFSLRKIVVDYIKENLQDFWDLLSATMSHSTLDPPLSAINTFLDRLQNEAEWVGEETILAVTRVFSCSVIVYNEAGQNYTYRFSDADEYQLRIVYRYSEDKSTRNHYDSVIQFTPHGEEIANDPVPSDSSIILPMSNPNPNPIPVSGVDNYHNIPTGSIRQTSQPSSQPCFIDASGKILVATWNVRGCSNPDIRNDVDTHFIDRRYLLVALQETRMASCTLSTTNYIWYNVNDNDNHQMRIGGGTAILVHKHIHNETHFRRIISNSCSYYFHVFERPLLFISTYIRSSTSAETTEFDLLQKYITTLPDRLQSHIGNHPQMRWVSAGHVSGILFGT